MSFTGVLRRILQLTIQQRKFDRAFEVKELCEKMNFEKSPGMQSSILDFFIATKDIDAAQQALTQINEEYPQFVVDKYRIVDLATLLVESNRLVQAKKFLESEAIRNAPTNIEQFSRNVWRLLGAVAETAIANNLPGNHAQEFCDFLIELGYCHPTNVILGPIVQEFLGKNQFHQAVDAFERFAAKHKSLPMHFALMQVFVESVNSGDDEKLSKVEATALLDRVTQVVVNKHGEKAAYSNLIVAFAQHGTEKQLRKLLLTRPFDVDQLKKHVANLSDEGQVTALLKLAKCSDGFHVDFQQGFIYEMLLERHVRQNDCAGALQLFEEITQGEGKVKLTSKFVSDLKDLLKMNKMEVPSKILLRKF